MKGRWDHSLVLFCCLPACGLLAAAPAPTKTAGPDRPPGVRIEAAEKGQESAKNSDQRAVAKLFGRAEQHYFKKNFHTAAELLKRVVEADPEHAQAHAYLGDVYLVERDADRAISHIRIAIELSKDPSREWFRLGQALYLKGDAARALDAYARAYRGDPQLHEVHFQTGAVHLHLLRDAKATVRDWLNFRRLRPDDPQGPAIDRAIHLLQDPNFKLPGPGNEPCLPGASDSRVPDRKPAPSESKEDNRTKEIIPVEEL